jgi:hypothetical protein
MRLLPFSAVLLLACASGPKPSDTGDTDIDPNTDQSVDTDGDTDEDTDIGDSGDTAFDPVDTDEDTDLGGVDTDDTDTADSADTGDSAWGWDTGDSGSGGTGWGAGDTSTYGDFCAPTDPYEPNSVPSQATPTGVAADGDTFVSAGAQLNGVDVDHYLTSVPVGCRLDMTLTFDPSAVEPDIGMAPAGGFYTGPFGVAGEVHAAYPNNTGAPVDVRASVSQYDSTCLPYTVEFEIVCPGPCVGGDSDEPNDDTATATDVGLVGVGTYSQADAGLNGALLDRDFYKIALDPGCGAEAVVSYDPADANVQAYMSAPTADGDQGSSNSGVEDVVSFNPTDYPQTVFLEVYTFDLECALYDVDIDVTCDGAAPGIDAVACANDPYEDNNDRASATETVVSGSAGSWDAGGIGSDARDLVSEDWFAVEVPHGCALYAEMTSNPIGGDLDLFLFDATAELSSSEGFTGREAVAYLAADAADTDTSDTRVWLQVVTNASQSCNVYDLYVDVYCPDAADVQLCGADAYESNDTIGTATESGVGPGNTSFSADRVDLSPDLDYFHAVIPAGCTLDSAVDFVHAMGDIDLRLVDASANDLDTSLRTGDGEAISYTNTGATDLDVYLQVGGWGSFYTCSVYDIDLTLSCP